MDRSLGGTRSPMLRSRRSAARTLVLLRLAHACVRGGRLEMISAWLLFLRLLRATTGVKKPDDNEITEGEREATEQQLKDQEILSTSPMEISQLVEGETHVEECQYSEDGLGAHSSKCLDTGKGSFPTRAGDKSKDGADDSENGTELERGATQQVEDEIKRAASDRIESDQEPVLQGRPVKEETKSNAGETGCQERSQPFEEETKNTMACNANNTALQGLDQPMEEGNKSTLKVSTLQGLDRPTEDETNKTMFCDTQETALQEQHQLMDRETYRTVSCDANEEPNQQVEEETQSTMACNANEAIFQTQSMKEEANQDQGQSCFDTCYLTEVDVKSSLSFDATERDGQAEEQEVKEEHERTLSFDETQTDYQAKEEDGKVESQLINEDDSNTTHEQEKDHQVRVCSMEKESKNALPFEAKNVGQHVQEPTVEDETGTLSSDAIAGDLQPEKADDIPSSLEPLDMETVLERQIKELAVSDASTESCHDESRDDLSDCLHVEMAMVSSDSDNEERWKSVFSPVVDEDDLEPGFNTERAHAGQATGDDLTSVSERKPEDPTSQTQEGPDIPGCPTECDPGESLSSSLSKIPEDEERAIKRGLQRLSASTSELDRKLPRDFRVVQDRESDGVSTEHLDFKSARRRWQEMEERSRRRSLQPTVRQESCQGGRGLAYTPVRTLERSGRDPETYAHGPSLGDHPSTQLSPSSDDSGLDDASYRSHNDEPETPVEREIRETLEREESFRRERARSRPDPEDPTANELRPTSLFASGPDPDPRKLYNTREDRCRSQRSPTTKSPTSPLPKNSYQEMLAKNVIILEPDPHPASSRLNSSSSNRSDLLSPTSRFHEWPAGDTSNVIVLETSNLIIRSVSEFCLSQPSTFQDNPFFRLRSRSTQSLVDREIEEVRQRDEEFRRQRALLYTGEKYDTVLVSPCSPLSFTYDKPGGTPAKCKSSPSSPLRVRRMDRSTLSCDQKFPEAPVFHRVRRKSALVQRWEAAVFGNRQQHV